MGQCCHHATLITTQQPAQLSSKPKMCCLKMLYWIPCGGNLFWETYSFNAKGCTRCEFFMKVPSIYRWKEPREKAADQNGIDLIISIILKIKLYNTKLISHGTLALNMCDSFHENNYEVCRRSFSIDVVYYAFCVSIQRTLYSIPREWIW